MSFYKFKKEDAYAFARRVGIQLKERGGELIADKCPYCGDRSTAQFKFSINAETGQFQCFRASCGVHGNMVTLAHDFDFSLGRDVDEYYQPKKGWTRAEIAKIAVRKAGDLVKEYFQKRGISAETLEKYHVGTHAKYDKTIAFVFGDEKKKPQFVKYRRIDFDPERDKGRKEWCEDNGRAILFGMPEADPAKGPLVITEGQIDSLSCAEAGIPNAVSVPTGAKGTTWIPHCYDFVKKFNKIVVFGDYEEGHMTLRDMIESRFSDVVFFVRPESYKDCKDANEILQKYGAAALREAVDTAVRPEINFVVSYTDVPRTRQKRERFYTGMKSVDRLLGGFRTGQLVVVTGKRGKGKSTLCSQFVINAVNRGFPVFYYSGELPTDDVRDWIDRQAVGPDYVNARTGYDGDTMYSVDATQYPRLNAFFDGKLSFYDSTALFKSTDDVTLEDMDVLKLAEQSVKRDGTKVFLFDNLATMMVDNLSADEYRQQAKYVWMLKKFAERYDVIVFLVAHPRKESGGGSGGYKSDDVGGSGKIVDLANTVIRYDIPSGADDTSEERRFWILKNRDNDGRLTKKEGIEMHFDTASKRISDTEGEKAFKWDIFPCDDLPF